MAFFILHTAEHQQATGKGLGRQGWSNPSQLRIYLCPTVCSELRTGKSKVQRDTDPPPAYLSNMNSIILFYGKEYLRYNKGPVSGSHPHPSPESTPETHSCPLTHGNSVLSPVSPSALWPT